jgi:hypothetical protein
MTRLHSDGKKYSYPKVFFSTHSPDPVHIFFLADSLFSASDQRSKATAFTKLF